MSVSRREFLTQTFAAGTFVVAASRVAASDTVNVGLIGCKNMGYNDLKDMMTVPGVRCTALCDIDDEWLNRRARDVQDATGNKPKLYKDFRKLLEQKDLDAVIIGTPDHWHCLQEVYACQAGKDVYVEKPIANSIAECELMLRAARKYNRVVQVGQQQRSGKLWHDAIGFVKSGKLGKIRRVNVWANFNYGSGQAVVPDSPVPEGVDFDMWLGPAPERTFNKARFHGSWRMFWDYGGGLMTDWGVHLLDMVLWGMDIKGAPKTVYAGGGRFDGEGHAAETPDTLNVLYQFDDFVVTWESNGGVQSGPNGRIYGIAFVGTNGTLWADRDNWQVIPENNPNGDGDRMDKVPPQPTDGQSHINHVHNFIECIKTRETPAADISIGYDAAFYAQLGNVAYRSGTVLQWDENTKSFGDNAGANALLKPNYRAPWQWPEI